MTVPDEPRTSTPCDPRDPVFAAPWQAQAFAMVLALHERGVFTWPQWVDHFSAALARSRDRGAPDDLDAYYLSWLDALEAILVECAVARPLALASLRQAWRLAAESTPHGQPIRLNPAMLRMAGVR